MKKKPTHAASRTLFDVEPKSIAKRVSPKESWLAPFGEAWESTVGGEPNWGRFARVLGQLKKRHRLDVILENWHNYLANLKDPAYASVQRFSETFMQHSLGSSGSRVAHNNQTALDDYYRMLEENLGACVRAGAGEAINKPRIGSSNAGG